MPKTKVSSKKKKTISVPKGELIPTLESLAVQARDGEDGMEEDEDLEEAGTPATIRKPTGGSKAVAHGLTEDSRARKNLRELFSAEETIIETITLEGKGAKHELPGRTESMAIFLRVRPLLQPEVARGEYKGCFSILPQRKGIYLNPPIASHSYRRLGLSQDGKVAYDFTHVLGDDLQQSDVFERTMRKPIQEFLAGTSQLVFTYGVTNSGKTYTLLGPRGNPGILPRALNRIFAAVGGNISQHCKYQPNRYESVTVLDGQAQREAKDRRENYLAMKTHKAPKLAVELLPPAMPNLSQGSQGSEFTNQSTDAHGFFDFRPTSAADTTVIHDRDCIDEDATYEAWVTFIEIYEDVAYDLLDFHNTGKTGRALRSGTLKVTDEGDTCYAQGLIAVPVFSAADAYHIMGIGRKNLHVAATKLNEASSRSHSIFTIKLVKITTDIQKRIQASVTQLTFCDLAGTERASRTDNVGARMKESQNINKDLHHLKECIEALRKSREVKPGRKRDLVPYRNCKLTKLFRSFFSGKGVASMIVNISQCASDFDETVNAIKFGSSAMRIMIPMTKRESILIQATDWNGNSRKLIHQNIVSVQLEEEDSMDSTIEEGDEDEENEENEGPAPSTVKKQPRGLGPSSVSCKTTVLKKKQPLTAVRSKNGHGTVTKATVSSTAKRGRKAAVVEQGRPLDEDSTSEEGSASETNTDTDEPGSDHDRASTAEEDGDESEQSEADLTLGGAVRGDLAIPDNFWEDNCPFPEHIHEEDQRIRGLLLLLGSCQNQIKQSKAVNMANEMKVRRNLCDYYDKESCKRAKEFAQALKKREEQFEEDLQKQLMYQRDAFERQLQARGDPSLMSFESHEIDAQKDQEIEELKNRIVELEEKLQMRKTTGNN